MGLYEKAAETEAAVLRGSMAITAVIWNLETRRG